MDEPIPVAWGDVAVPYLGIALPQLSKDCDYIIAEQPVIIRGPIGDQLLKAMALVNYCFDGRKGFKWVQPHQWKDSRFRLAPLPGKGMNPHEKDAYRMALWYQSKVAE
jgi:hypothetical protein